MTAATNNNNAALPLLPYSDIACMRQQPAAALYAFLVGQAPRPLP